MACSRAVDAARSSDGDLRANLGADGVLRVCLLVGLAFVRVLAKITLIDSSILVPLVLSTAFAGSYAIDMSIENVVVTGVFGLLGYLMMRYDYPRLMIIVALVLGGNIERNLHQSMLMETALVGLFCPKHQHLSDARHRRASRAADLARAL